MALAARRTLFVRGALPSLRLVAVRASVSRNRRSLMIRLRDRRLRDGDRNGVACLRAVTDDLLCFFNIELHAGLAGDDGLAVLLADGRVDRTAGDILCNFVDVDGRRSGHIGRDLIGFEIHQLDLRGERLFDSGGIELHARRTGLNDEVFPVELPCRCDRLGKRLGGDLLELGFQTRFIDRSVQTGIAAIPHRADDRCHARERPALAADLPCVFRRLDIVYAAQNVLDRNIIIRIIDRERELFTLIERLAFYGNLLCGFIARQTADVDRADCHAGENVRIEINCAERAACEQHEQDEDNDERGGNAAFSGGSRSGLFCFFLICFDEVRALSGFAGMECHGDLLLFMRRAARPSVCVRVYAMPASERHRDYHFIIYCCAERCNNKSVSECFSPPPHKMTA